jgi:uncharacterized membrane protein YhaH (DUF805 family)
MAFKSFEQPMATRAPALAGGGDLTIGSVLVTPFSFRGRATRLEFWMVFLCIIVLQVTLAAVFVSMGLSALEEHSALLVGLGLPLGILGFWVTYATYARRLRDRGWETSLIVAWLAGPPVVVAIGSAIFPPLSLIAYLAGFWVFIECGFLGSQP